MCREVSTLSVVVCNGSERTVCLDDTAYHKCVVGGTLAFWLVRHE